MAVRAMIDGGCDEVVVGMGAAIVEPPEGTSAVIVEEWSEGVGATVRAVVRTARARSVDGVLLGLVDTPDVGPEVVRRIVDRAAGRRNALVRAVFGGRPGHPVYLGADHFDGVLATVHGDVGARPYLRAHAAEVIDVECGDLASGLDQDT